MQDCPSTPRTSRRRRSGHVILSFALSATALIGFLGLAVDAAYFEMWKRKAQAAADSAAAGALFEMQANPQGYVAAGRFDAARNGFDHGVGGATVTFNVPPTSGALAGQSGAVEAIVSRTMPTFFMSVLGRNSLGVAARAVASLSSSPSCIYALSQTASPALSASGSVTVNSACGIYVNSSSSSAMTLSNGACITAPSWQIVGGYNAGTCQITPPPATGIAPAADPLASVPAPAVGSCNFTNFRVSGSGTVTMNPGVYCGGIRVTGSANLVLNPGLYILNGGGLHAGGSGTVNGSGVTFYNTGGSNMGDVSFTGGSGGVLSAPTTGPYAGVLFFQDRVTASQPDAVFSGNSLVNFDGALYFPKAQIHYTGSSSVNGYTLVVGDRVTFTGNTTVKNNYTTLPGGSPARSPSIGE